MYTSSPSHSSLVIDREDYNLIFHIFVMNMSDRQELNVLNTPGPASETNQEYISKRWYPFCSLYPSLCVYLYTCSLYSTTCFDAHVETYVNARKHTQLKYPTTGAYLELDIWIPEYEISFEFQVFEHLHSLMTTSNNDV